MSLESRRKSKREWQRRNAEKFAAYKKRWTAENIEQVTAQRRDYYLKNKKKMNMAGLKYRLKSFGMSINDFDRMLKHQDGVCAICTEPSPKRRLDIDHCHATGRVRGLLCRQCNHALGFMCDDVDRFAAAIGYLLSH